MDDPDEIIQCNTGGGEEVDIMANPSVAVRFQLTVSYYVIGKIIGFCTRSIVVHGPEKIEVLLEHHWIFRFIAHDYSVLLDFPVSRKVLHNCAHHDLDTYGWSLDYSLRSRCSHDNKFKKLLFARYAMDLTFLHYCEHLKGEFLDRLSSGLLIATVR